MNRSCLQREVGKLLPIFVLPWLLVGTSWETRATAAEIVEITAENRPQIDGKEVDWIDGDFILRNDQVVMVVGRPVATRDANMTVRKNGAGIIDLTRLDMPSDQLSAFYPTAGRFIFADDTFVETGSSEGEVFWRCRSSSPADPRLDGTLATVEYRLRDGDSFVSVAVTFESQDGKATQLPEPYFGVRADRTFDFGSLTVGDRPVAYFADDFFRQTYLITCEQEAVDAAKWLGSRMKELRFEKNGSAIAAAGFNARLYPASSLVDGIGLITGGASQTIRVENALGVDPRVRLEITKAEENRLGSLQVPKQSSWYADATGGSIVHLPPGQYRVKVSAIGHTPTEATWVVGEEPAEHVVRLGPAALLAANVTDQNRLPIPFKMTVYGVGDTPNPSFGPDSADGSIGNCVYVTSGTVKRSLPDGKYECVFSCGPEYDAMVRQVAVSAGGQVELDIVLPRVVNTPGWISAELHSHSSPSGDNTSSQLGRVQNLLCEHIEFAPCTEHQRIDSYDSHLQALEMVGKMATCSGMELTGSPLPINHQNAFPLIHRPHQQHGGGPLTDTNPEVQIQRLAMWDSGAEKVVQINHPNIEQMARDRDLDGIEDEGFSKMFEFVDIIEIHPPQDIFVDLSQLDPKDAKNNRVHQWLRLMNGGRFIPGVVNTDAHYNWHGSGWLRNWILSTSDDPAKISIDEMTHNLEAGRVIMSTGPFMKVELNAAGLEKPAQIGDSVVLEETKCTMAIEIQCANWLDVNRVDIFVNGQRNESLSFTRRQYPEYFSNEVVRFQRQVPIELTADSIIIVAAIGEGLTLGRVMGEEFGQLPPVVVSNPIFVKVRK